MNQTFGRLLNRFVCVYLDDILIFSKTEAEHLEHLEQVLQLLQKHDFKAKMSKCEFFKPELKFLGHIISADGMRPDPAKVATVVEWPTPASVYEVRSFLGLANYFRKYIKGYSAIAAPLTELLKGVTSSDKKGKQLRFGRLPKAEVERIKADFAKRWSPACAAAFAELKQVLTSAPVLMLPDFNKRFELVADACECPPAIGAVLMQKGKPVAYHSRKLSGPELSYSASDIEMLAVISALSEWRCYLEGSDFDIVTDHKPNTYLDEATNAHTVKRRARWLDISCGYTYNWVYRPGRVNVADPISRAPQHFRKVAERTSVLHALRASGGVHAPGLQQGQNAPHRAVAAPAQSTCCSICSHAAAGRSLCPPNCQDAGNVGHLCDAAGATASQGGSDTPNSDQQCSWELDPLDAYIARKQAEAAELEESWRASRDAALQTCRRVAKLCDIDGRASPLAVAAAEDDESAPAHQFFQENFFERVVKGYAAEGTVSSAQKQALNLREDQKGLLWTAEECLYIPNQDDLRKECYEMVHIHPYSGHYGGQRTITKATQIFYWPSMAKDIRNWVACCDSCQRVKALCQKPAGKLQPLQIPGRRWESVSMDLITDLPRTKEGNDSIWVVVDRLSKMVHLVPLKKTCTAEKVAEAYEKNVFKLHGIPQSIVSDRDVRFTSRFWKAMNERFKTRLLMSTKGHPQTDGQTENANGVLEDTLRHFVGPYQNDWEERLAVAEFAMNNSWNASIQNTPFMLNYGQNPDDPTVAFLRMRNPAVNKFVGRWSEQLQHAKQCLKAAQDRMKATSDKRRRESPDYRPGDEVLLNIKMFRLSATSSRKLAPRWVGPFKIKRAVGPYKLAYELELPQVVQHMHPVFHVSALRPYLRDGPYTPPPLPDYVEGEPEWEVAYVADTRYSGAQRQYRVAWEGMTDHDTWEPLSNMTNCAEKIKEFWESRGQEVPEPLPKHSKGKPATVEQGEPAEIVETQSEILSDVESRQTRRGVYKS